MSDREKLIVLVEKSCSFAEEECYRHNGECNVCQIFDESHECKSVAIADHLLANGVTVAAEARPIEEWHEDFGDVLWWTFPIEEPPYVGSPLCDDWTGWYTHWTPIVCPVPPKGE